jgi:acetyl esterase/lipase
MRKTIIHAFATMSVLAAGLAQAAPGDRLRERLADRQQGVATVSLRPDQTIAYGSDPLQQVDVWKATGLKRKAPLVFFVHGGGWKRGDKQMSSKSPAAAHFTGQGYAYASTNYRLVPATTVEEQARDIARAMKAVLDRADSLGIDRSRVVITGHSAGAHLVALLGTDEQYLKSAGLSFADLDGVIPNDGAAYDVAAQMQDGPKIMNQTYVQAFGTDPTRQRALSPTLNADAPNAPAFLLIHVQRPDGVRQNKALEAALRTAGTAVERREFAGEGLRGHMEINRQLGDPAYPATPVVDAWLKRLFAG